MSDEELKLDTILYESKKVIDLAIQAFDPSIMDPVTVPLLNVTIAIDKARKALAARGLGI